MKNENGLYRWLIDSRAFLVRARQGLEAFDGNDDVGQLFTAALMLRYGIEARLFEYIYHELPKNTRDDDISRISEFAASRLLNQLTDLNPRAAIGSTVVIRPDDGSEAFGFRYTPMTKSLAALHGRLGGLLHMNYFKRNRHWYISRRSDRPGTMLLLDARDLVAQGIDELAEVTSGTLLAHPSFGAALGHLLDEVDEVDHNPPAEELGR